MNFSPFGSHFPATIPSIHQFAAKFTQDNNFCPTQDTNSNRYTANGVPSFTQHHHPPAQQPMINKYPNNYINQSLYNPVTLRQDKRQSYEQQDLAQELCAAMQQVEKQQQHQQQQQQQQHQQQQHQQHQQQVDKIKEDSLSSIQSSWQSLATPGSTVADYLSHLPASTLPLSLHHFLKYSAENMKKDTQLNPETNLNFPHPTPPPPPPPPPSSAQPSSTTSVSGSGSGSGSSTTNLSSSNNSSNNNSTNPLPLTTLPKKKKKKKAEKEKKPRPKPGEIRLTTALDGSTLYCCPECHMAYPEKELLEQHLLGHTLERRFVCDICGAGLKRKDHLTRHKQSHNPERPYVCTVCLKAFKRKEQLTLHFVIHSGEKRHICTECGKGFYRKDHLRKHTRSHIARRVKAELSQQGSQSSNSLSQGI